MKRVRLIKMCLKEICNRVQIGIHVHLSDLFPIKNGLKKGDNLSPLLFNFACEHVTRAAEIKLHPSASI